VDRGHVVVAIVAAIVLWATPGASADIVAAVDVPVAAGAATGINQHPDQFDVALLNATTGSKFNLPAGINTTTADEFHPSVTPDGKWLAFERVDPVGGTTRIIAANLSTSQTADLFNIFEVGSLQPATPFVEADGSSVLVGAPFSFRPRWTATSLANFPGGPFPHTGTQFLITEPNENQTLDPVDTSFAQATTVVAGSTGLEGVITQQEFSDGSDAAFIAPDFDPAATVGFAHPTISDPTTRVVVLERRRHGSCQSSTNCTVRAVLAFIGLGTSGNPQPAGDRQRHGRRRGVSRFHA
jgi:WD40-like Beta Propeller Repeat